MKIKFGIIISLCFLSIFFLALYCTNTRTKNFSITDAIVQRIEFDSCLIDKNFYFVELAIDFRKEHYIPSPFYNSRIVYAEDDVDSIIIKDASGKLIKERTEILSGKDDEIDDFIYIHPNIADSSESHILTGIINNWEGIQKHMNASYRITMTNFIFYTDKDKPLPETFILKFKDREIRTKVNNTPKHVFLEKESELICDSGKVKAVHKEDK